MSLKFIHPICFATVLLFSACLGDESKKEQNGPDLYDQPTSHKFISQGYKIDPVRGDTILPVVIANGDTVETGKEVKLMGEVFSLDTLQGPVVEDRGMSDTIPARSNVFEIALDKQIRTLDTSKLIYTPIQEREQVDSSKFILNTLGDTLYTGVKIPAVGRVLEYHRTAPTSAQTMRMKDNAVYDIYFWNEDLGVRSPNVYSLIKDQRGNIWYGTESGFGRFDGKRFQHFAAQEGFLNAGIISLYEDRKGNIWIGSWGGLTKFDGFSFTHFDLESGLADDRVSSITETQNGDIWFCGYDGGLTRYDGQSFTHYTAHEGLSNNELTCLYEDKGGLLWIGTTNGLNCYDGKNMIQYPREGFLSNNGVRDIEEGRNNTLWIGTQGGVEKIQQNSCMTYTSADGLPSSACWTLEEDRFGNIWVGTISGLAKISDNTITQITEEHGLSNNFVASILTDSAGNCWVGTFGGGLNKIRINGFEHFLPQDRFKLGSVSALCEDPAHRIWLGTSAGLVLYEDNRFTRFTKDDRSTTGYIPSIIALKNGDVWFSDFDRGVVHMKNNQLFHYGPEQGFPSSVQCLLEDRKGQIWMSTMAQGVYVYDGETMTHFSEENGFLSNYTSVISEDKDGNIWISTSSGIAVYNGETFFYYTGAEGLTPYIAAFLHEDKSLNKWIGIIGGGLFKFDGTSFTHYDEQTSSLNKNVYSVVESWDGDLWFGTWRNGLTHFDGSKFYQFGKLDGLKSAEFYNGSSMRDHANNAYWASKHSLVKLDLNTVSDDKPAPIAALSYITVHEQFLDFGKNLDSLQDIISYDSVSPFDNYPIDPSFDYHQNHITFHFTAYDWNAPHKLIFQYMLVGLDEDWSEITDQMYADYRNIPYGDYTFKVRAMNSFQIWSEPFEYHFEILPPWYHTWWARGLFVLGGVLLIVLYVRWRTNKLKKRQAQLERDIEKATEEIRLQKSEVEQQKEQIEEAHKEITDSIHYAQRLQRSLMASQKLLDENLASYFVYFNPKEAVSGDFYWAGKLANGNFALVCADSTGHGVPGAIMSMLNMNALREAVKEGLTKSDEILNYTRSAIIETLSNDGSSEGGKDGMDAVLLIFSHDRKSIEFSMANNPVWIIRNEEIIEFKPDKMPIGKHDKQHIPFSRHTEELQQGDMLYIFSDGFADQFGGEKGKKFKYASLKQLLLSCSNKPADQQQLILTATFNNWRGSLEQVDDVCVIGVKI